MKFRPCIDLHDGIVKQIVGGTLKDATANDVETPVTNFVSTKSAKEYAILYKNDKLIGGHVIMLGKGNETAALEALNAYPNGLQIGGGINDENALFYLNNGASQVIVTSYIFNSATGEIDYSKLQKLLSIVGSKEKLVLDLSCRKRMNAQLNKFEYYVVINRWQTFTNVKINKETLSTLSSFCCEFLIHGVDVEGLRSGIEDDLVVLLSELSPIPVTYAGGIRDIADIEHIKEISHGKIDFTIGSALDIFGGSLSYNDVVEWCNKYGNSVGQE
jgi:phosphoribosylformimino-5-aminoimidazole carboxamide ribotide isomerase